MEVTFSLYMKNLPYAYPQFCRVFRPQLQTPHKCSYSHPLHVRDSNHTHPINELAIVTALSRQPLARAGQDDCFLNQFVHRRTAVDHSEPTKAFSKRSSETPCCLHRTLRARVHPPTSPCPTSHTAVFVQSTRGH